MWTNVNNRAVLRAPILSTLFHSLIAELSAKYLNIFLYIYRKCNIFNGQSPNRHFEATDISITEVSSMSLCHINFYGDPGKNRIWSCTFSKGPFGKITLMCFPYYF